VPEPSIAPTPQPTPEEVRRHLEVILASRPFASATRARRFLSHIVEQTLAGNTAGIKELVLGIEVFDRAGDFDPKIDTIVRVEAGKLRKRLDEYYADEGAAAPLRIEIPKGSYIPQFHLRDQTPAPQEIAAPSATLTRYVAPVLVLVALTAASWWAVAHFRSPAPQTTPSIAVLPFLNLSPDPANEYFADGLSEELTDALCNAGGLRVASRTSSFSFKGKSSDTRDIAAKLHVGFIVEGSVRKQGEQLKVTAQLIRTDDGYHLWSGSFERRLSDVFAVQQELANSVVSALQVRLTGSQARRLKKAHTANQQAFDLYLRGKHVLNSFGPEALDRAERFYQQSIAADPAYALAYLGLAEVYGFVSIQGTRPALETAAKGRTAIQKALELDDELSDAHAARGTLAARHEYDWAAAERHLRHALELNPSSARAHYELGQNVLAPQARWREAAAETRLAAELDPLSPIIAMGDPWLAYLARRYDASIDGFRALAAASPTNLMAIGGAAFALSAKGDYPAALDNLQRMQAVAPSPQNLGFIAGIYARQGNPGEARKILQQLLSEKGFVSPATFSLIYMGLGDADNAFRYTELARQQQESSLIYVRVSNLWDPFRGDPRYQTLLREVGLSDEQIQKNQSSHR
jgi:TolB-like protein